MEFANPEVLYALAVVPVVAVLLVYGERRRREELGRFAGPVLADALAPGRSWRKSLLKGVLKTGALVMLVVALAGPRFGIQLVKMEREGVDLVITLDTSISMLAEDMLPNRLERAKQEIVDLIRGLRGDRVGMVVFAGDAFTLCPLTLDYDAALMFARTVDVDAVSEPGTNLERAIDESVALFERSVKRDRAIILVTDGESHEGDAVASAQKAGERGIRIYTIGIGNPKGELIPERGTDGAIAGYKKDKRGQTVLTHLDERTLQQVASASKGKYLPATREGLELKVLYNEISGMERRIIKGEFVERKRERFYVFLAGALLLLLADAAVSSKAFFRPTGRGRVLHTGAAAIILAMLTSLASLVLPVAAEARSVKAGKVRAGNGYYQAEEYDKAQTLYVESLGDTLSLPKHYQGVLYNLGNTLYMQEKYREAIELYQRTYSEDSTLTGKMLYNRANTLLKSSNAGAAVESYVQALQYLPDDEDARFNLELALEMLRQQQQQNQKQGEQQDQQQQSQQEQGQDQQRQEQQQKQEGQRKEQQEEQQAQPSDSTKASEARPDSAMVPPQLTPEDLQKLTKEDAMRILQALKEQEDQLQRERRKAAFQRVRRSGKDW